jgi:cytochrome c556
MRPAPLALVFGLSLAGAAVAAGMSVKDEMTTVIAPASTTIFAVSGEVDPANGPDAAKVPEARWHAAVLAAQALKRPAADLIGPQKEPGAVWTKSAHDFARLAAAAEAAARKKDAAALSTAANGLGETCATCHAKYKPKTGD